MDYPLTTAHESVNLTDKSGDLSLVGDNSENREFCACHRLRSALLVIAAYLPSLEKERWTNYPVAIQTL